MKAQLRCELRIVGGLNFTGPARFADKFAKEAIRSQRDSDVASPASLAGPLGRD